MEGSGQIAVPPGFRFHPTDEELLYYYLRKKVSFEAIDPDVIREVDLNKLEPWDLKGLFLYNNMHKIYIPIYVCFIRFSSVCFYNIYLYI